MVVSEMFGWVGSAIAFWAVLQQVLPRQYTEYIADRILNFVSPYNYFDVLEFDGQTTNDLYYSVNVYLSSLTGDRARRSSLSTPKNSKKLMYGLSPDQYIHDRFRGATLRWEHKMAERKNPFYMGPGKGESVEKRMFELKILQNNKRTILDAYMAYITEKAKEIQRVNRAPRLHSNRKGSDRDYFYFSSPAEKLWSRIPFRHPATFDTIALNPEKRLSIIDDLDEFVNGEEFYRRTGKAWKRGYLLYGPPGTGKTSIVAAMANKLQYDVYDLELTEVKSNAQLRDLLVYTESKSIIVIEDIDCSLDLSGQRKKESKKKKPDDEVPSIPGLPKPEDDAPSKVTLSGLLNFTDGLWSCCEDERIFVFTTNYVNKLEPALLRPGRMDMHINLSYCTFSAFTILATNILQIDHHALYPQVKELFNDGTRITPSEIAEVLTRNRKSAENAMEELIECLEKRKANPPPPEPKPEDYKAEAVETDKSKLTNEAAESGKCNETTPVDQAA